ncbi:MAG TPA: FAD-dependent oxidoreductase [Actinomycetota bacterium]|nr:FAD-dependent oxidoreductase [Actinomycetota bacterium]
MELPGRLGSFWVESTAESAFPRLRGDITVDVAVIGGGIAGLTSATLLKEAGRSVAVIESKRIVRGATGYTTAKLTSGHGLIYRHLIAKFGVAKARAYADANQAAIAEVAGRVDRHSIDCDFERRANYVYADERDKRESIEKEVEATLRLGLPASFIDDPPLPVETRGAIRLDDQAEFHPRKYLLALAASLTGDSSHIFELTRALQVEDGRSCRVVTDAGDVHARDVLILTQIPFLDRGLFFTKVHPYRAYVLAAPISDEHAPDGMFLTSKSPTRSIRSTPLDGRRLLLLGGEGHKTGTVSDNEQRFAKLDAFLRAHFDAGEVIYRWATQDYYSVDRVPYIGPLTRGTERIRVATGFGGWGMSGGTAAAMILSDAVLGNRDRSGGVFASKRWRPRASSGRLVKENALVARHWLLDAFIVPTSRAPESVRPGEADILRIAGRRVAFYRDESGEPHAVSAVCSHLACLLRWNAAERSWDCPCHGSRFDVDGVVLQGPAVRDLERFELNALRRAEDE